MKWLDVEQLYQECVYVALTQYANQYKYKAVEIGEAFLVYREKQASLEYGIRSALGYLMGHASGDSWADWEPDVKERVLILLENIRTNYSNEVVLYSNRGKIHCVIHSTALGIAYGSAIEYLEHAEE